MKYLNIDLSTLRSPAYIGSAPTERGTWLSILGYCADQENGGRIVGAMTWKDRQWQQVCGVTLREVRATTRLLFVDGDDVLVYDYPSELEHEIQVKREAGRNGGQARTQAKAQAARVNGAKHNPSTTQAEHITDGQAELEAKPKQEPNVRECKVREGKVSNTYVGQNDPAAGAAPTSPEPPLSDAAAPTKADEQTDADWLASLCSDPAYTGIDVVREHAKCVRWCHEHGKQPTRRRFVNWLNRCDKPMNAGASEDSERIAKVNGYEY